VVDSSPVTGFSDADVPAGQAVPVVELGGSHVAGALVGPDGNPPAIRNLTTAPVDPAASAEVLLDAVLRCARALDAPKGARWGVAVPGPFDYAAGVAWYRGVAKFDSLYGVDVGGRLRDGLGPGAAADLVFLGDAEAFALGEWVFGAGRSCRRILGVTLGTGVGASFLDGGIAILGGPDVPPAGRADLLRVDDRPLEEHVSTRAIVERYAHAGGPSSSAEEIAERARGGEDRARALLALCEIPETYKADVPASAAVSDLFRILQLRESGETVAFELWESEGYVGGVPVEDAPASGHRRVWRLTIYRTGTPITLTDVLPRLQHMGVDVVDEHPYEFGGADVGVTPATHSFLP